MILIFKSLFCSDFDSQNHKVGWYCPSLLTATLQVRYCSTLRSLLAPGDDPDVLFVIFKCVLQESTYNMIMIGSDLMCCGIVNIRNTCWNLCPNYYIIHFGRNEDRASGPPTSAENSINVHVQVSDKKFFGDPIVSVPIITSEPIYNERVKGTAFNKESCSASRVERARS